MSNNSKNKNDFSPNRLAIGLSLGVCFGILFKNLAMGISLGLLYGLLFKRRSNND
jgi:hypothetical protein